jgi:hypothetical protein
MGGWGWSLLAAVAGFAASAVLSGIAGFPRHGFVAAWTLVVLALWASFATRQRVNSRIQLGRRWRAGLVVGSAVGALLAATVARQPASEAPSGGALAVDLIWLGVAYGVADALILSVLPVLALYGAQPAGVLHTPAGRLRAGALALAGSGLITAAYHLGFREFQGPQLVQPVLGNLVITAAYLVSGSAVAPMLAHVIMHGAAVLHGAATTVQLPPHY